MLWDKNAVSYYKAQNLVNLVYGMPATYPESEPKFPNTLFKDIISHKYGIIW